MHLISRARVKLNQWVLPLLNLPKPLSLIGAGSSSSLCHQIASTGARQVLLVTDGPLLKLGLIAPIIQTLKQAGITVTVFSDIEPDPSYEMVLAGVARLAHRRRMPFWPWAAAPPWTAPRPCSSAIPMHATPRS